MKVIMISGKSQSGKDCLAQLMKEELVSRGYKCLIIHFGDAVKWLAAEHFGYQGVKDEHDRAILQNLGTEIMRKKFPTYWAEIVAKFIAAANIWDIVLIPDTRFINEIDIVAEYNNDVVTIRVERYNADETQYYNPQMTEEQKTHISETELDDYVFEWILENSGTLEDFKDSAFTMTNLITGIF